MPIIDNELIGEGSGETSDLSVPISELFEQTIQKNIEQYGDSVWMVKYTLSLQITHWLSKLTITNWW